jgi:hypothetical protein
MFLATCGLEELAAPRFALALRGVAATERAGVEVADSLPEGARLLLGKPHVTANSSLAEDAQLLRELPGDRLPTAQWHEGLGLEPDVTPAGRWQTVSEAMSARARAYQTQVTGRTGEAYVVNGVRFDGVSGGTLLDGKGPGYATFVRNGRFQRFFNGQDALLDQARRQVAAANVAPITWHVAEADAATAMWNLLADNNITGINIVHTPVVP